jgi:hypothetical protein
MVERIEWRRKRLVAVKQAIHEIDTGPELVADDLGIGRNATLELGQSRWPG